MFKNIFQGSGAGSFATHTAEILIMWLVAGLIGLLTGYVLWHKYRRLCATLSEELAGLQLKLEQHETSITQLKLKNVELDAEAARWQSQYEALLADMKKKSPPPPPAGDTTLKILEEMADDLTAIEGIDTKVEDLLFNAGIHTFQDVANSKLETLHQILKAAGAEHPSNNPTLWRKQAFQLFSGRKAYYEGFAGLKIGRRQLEALSLRKG